MTDNTLFSKTIYSDEEKFTEVRLTVNDFRGVEYLGLREYYMDFDEQWYPTNKGITIPLSILCTKNLLTALLELVSEAESNELIKEILPK